MLKINMLVFYHRHYHICKRIIFERKDVVEEIDQASQCQNTDPPTISHPGKNEGLRLSNKRREREKREGKKETRENAKRGRGKGEQQLHEIRQRRTTRNFRHKSNDPPANFAGLALFSREWEGGNEKKRKNVSRFFPCVQIGALRVCKDGSIKTHTRHCLNSANIAFSGTKFRVN